MSTSQGEWLLFWDLQDIDTYERIIIENKMEEYKLEIWVILELHKLPSTVYSVFWVYG